MITRASYTRAAIKLTTDKNLNRSLRYIHHAVGYATAARPRSSRWPHARKSKLTNPQKEGLPPLRTLEMIEDYRSQLHNEQVVDAFELYQMLKRILSEEDIFNLIALFQNPKTTRLVESSSLLQAANAITQDLKTGSIPATPRILRSLLLFYKTSGNYEDGTHVWEWAATQDTLVDARVYGAAIEFGLARGDSLANLESLYQQAIASSDDNFLGYHLSHNAILPDRRKAQKIPGTSESLLRAICLARLHYGDYHNAYLGLDTALRLHPLTIDYRFFEPFILNRSIGEAYVAYQTACRSPAGRSAKLLKLMTRRLLTLPSIKRGPIPARIRTFDNMLNAIQAYVEGGDTAGMNLNAPYQSLLQVVYALLPQPDDEVPENIRSLLLSAIGTIASSMADRNIGLGTSHVNMLLNAAARLQSRDLFDMTMKSSASRKINFANNPVFQRVLLYSVGALQDAQLVQTTWQGIQQYHDASADAQETYKVWMTFGRAAKRADIMPFFHSEFEIHKAKMEPYIREHLVEHFPMNREESTENPVDTDTTSSQRRRYWANDEAVSGMTAQVSRICESLAHQKIRNFAENPFRMTLGTPLILPEELDLEHETRLRAVYEAMTVDPSAVGTLASSPSQGSDVVHQGSTHDQGSGPQPNDLPSEPDIPTKADDPVPNTATGYTIDELRYANWAAVTEMLAEAEVEESAMRSPQVPLPSEGARLAEEIVRLRTPRQFKQREVQHLDGLEILDE